MASIAWGPWQTEHITKRHRVSARDFDAAWHDPERRDLAEEVHEDHGPYYVSVGSSALGKALIMVWRWQDGDMMVWPITAYFPKLRKRPSARRR